MRGKVWYAGAMALALLAAVSTPELAGASGDVQVIWGKPPSIVWRCDAVDSQQSSLPLALALEALEQARKSLGHATNWPAQAPTPGLFEDVTAVALPGQDSSWAIALAVGDVDGDGDLDAFVGHRRRLGEGWIDLLLNDGSGVFHNAAGERLPRTDVPVSCLRLADLDGDGDLDLFAGYLTEDLIGVPQFLILVNDGRGSFRDETADRLPAGLELNTNVLIADLTGDGAPDILGVNRSLESDSTTLYLLPNDGNGYFRAEAVRRFRIERRAVSSLTAADIDGDGDLDALVPCIWLTVITIGQDTTRREYPGLDVLLVNDGTGNLVDRSAELLPPAGEDWTSTVVPGDVDGDGDVDLLFVNNLERPVAQDRLLINQGDGRFVDETEERLPPEPPNIADGALLADFTGDGYLDIFVWCQALDPRGPAPDRLLINDGAGHFRDVSAGNLPPIEDYTAVAAAGDLDGDGAPDLFLANRPASVEAPAPAQNRVYRNTGTLTAVAGRKRAGVPSAFRLLEPYPNPFNGSTTIGFELGRTAHVLVSLWDPLGRRVRVLLDGERRPGAHRVRWDGTDDSGRPLPSGMYLLRLEAGGEVAARKVVLAR